MTPSDNDDSLETAVALRRAVTLMARHLRRLRADHGVSAARLSLLGRLARARTAMTAVDLARQERLQPQSLTRLIADLDRRGLITRRPDALDRRALLIEITPRGQELLERDVRRQILWLQAALQARLTVSERGLLRLAAGVMEKLSDDAG